MPYGITVSQMGILIRREKFRHSHSRGECHVKTDKDEDTEENHVKKTTNSNGTSTSLRTLNIGNHHQKLRGR